MANDPSSIPIRFNQDTIKASWFNNLRQFLIDAFGAVTGQTSFLIGNNVSTPTDVGFSVDALAFTSAKVTYEIKRSSSDDNRMEVGELNLYYRNSIWEMNYGPIFGDNSLGGSNQIIISQAGSVAHLRFTSDNITGSGYVGTMKLKASYFTA